MKRNFLKELGIEEKETIDAILDENSRDIGKAKGELETYKDKVTELEDKLKTKETELGDLQSKVKDIDSLNEQIETLKSENQTLNNDLTTKISDINKKHAIENGVRDAKGKNIKAITALLDIDKITFENNELVGFTEQIEALQSGEDSAFLFDTKGGQQVPAGAKLNDPPASNQNTPSTSNSLAEAVAKALSAK